MIKSILKLSITLGALAVAAWLVWTYYGEYVRYPWTRDGQVQAYVVGVAARVSGPIVDVPVKDNHYVKRGDLLFAIDPTDYQQDLDRAKAALDKAMTRAEMLRLEVNRRTGMMEKKYISLEDYQAHQARYAEAIADIEVARAQLKLCELNLSYTRVYAAVDGYVTNLTITTGTYVAKGQPLMALVDADSFWVAGYFRETDLKHIAPGSRAQVRFMGLENAPVEGVVEGVGWGIFRHDSASAENLLPMVSPTVDWVRLAQRFPVRIRLLQAPPHFLMRVGATVSVVILPDDVKESTKQCAVESTTAAPADKTAPPSQPSAPAANEALPPMPPVPPIP